MLNESHPQVYNTSYPHNDWHLMLWWWGFRLTTSGLRALWKLCVVDASFPVNRLIPIALNFSVTRIRWESKPILGVRQSQGKAQKRRPPVFPEKTFFKSSCYGNFFVRVGPPINQKKVVWYFKQKTIKSFKSVGLDRQTISAHLGYFHFAWTGVDMAVIETGLCFRFLGAGKFFTDQSSALPGRLCRSFSWNLSESDQTQLPEVRSVMSLKGRAR